ncbi:MAG: phosphoglycerate mutase [Proteobacteria bacterium]|nr:phosphoglycerate mutase [Pseudomonadota bacterium]
MSVLHVLLPPLQGTGNDPEWRAWLARGDRLPDIRDARAACVRERFRFSGRAIPAAALRHHCHAGDAASGIWLCADPAYARSEATGARLMACPVHDLSAADADELAAALQPLFDEMAAAPVVDTPSSWCLRLPDGESRAAFTEPAAALGASLADCLPEGDTGRAWRRLFNEAQIALHAHPVNARRAAAGKVPVNALWFWGEGTLPDTVETGLQCVASTDDVLRGLAKMGGAVRLEPLPQAVDAAGGNGDVLLDLDIPGQSDAIPACLPSFRRWLRERRFNVISLVFASGERYRVRYLHGLRFWRRG